MALDRKDITAIATEVVRRLDIRGIAQELHRLTHEMSEIRKDAAYLVTLPHEELKRRWQAQWAAEKSARKVALESGSPLVESEGVKQWRRDKEKYDAELAEKRAKRSKKKAEV